LFKLAIAVKFCQNWWNAAPDGYNFAVT